MDRPGFESYNMMNMYPNYMMPMPSFIQGGNTCQNNNTNQNYKIQTLENEINNLKTRVSRLENSMYPEALDYSKTYQNSLNMM
jgi:hypothetical protein